MRQLRSSDIAKFVCEGCPALTLGVAAYRGCHSDTLHRLPQRTGSSRQEACRFPTWLPGGCAESTGDPVLATIACSTPDQSLRGMVSH